MATLEQAMLADYARVDQSGLLTIVGGGVQRVLARAIPTQQLMSVAARVGLDEDETEATFRLVFRDPNRSYQISMSAEVRPKPDAKGVHTMAAVATSIVLPLPSYGEYTVEIIVNDDLAKTLTFDVQATPTQA